MIKLRWPLSLRKKYAFLNFMFKKVLISNVNEKKLRAKKEAKGMSNILDVLSKYL